MSLSRRVENLEVRESRLALRVVRVEPVTLDTPADVLAVLGEQANAVRADPEADPLEKARAVGFLAALALRAMEARDLAERLEAVERVLKLRRENERRERRK